MSMTVMAPGSAAGPRHAFFDVGPALDRMQCRILPPRLVLAAAGDPAAILLVLCRHVPALVELFLQQKPLAQDFLLLRELLLFRIRGLFLLALLLAFLLSLLLLARGLRCGGAFRL